MMLNGYDVKWCMSTKAWTQWCYWSMMHEHEHETNNERNHDKLWKPYWAKVPRYVTQNSIGQGFPGMLRKTLLGKGSQVCYAKPSWAKVPKYVTQNPTGQRFQVCYTRQWQVMKAKIGQRFPTHVMYNNETKGFVMMFYDVIYMRFYARCTCMNMWLNGTEHMHTFTAGLHMMH